MNINRKISECILRHMNHIESIIGKQSWKIDLPRDNEMISITSPILIENQIESLECAQSEGLFWKASIYESDDNRVDTYCDTQYWIGVYLSGEDTSKEDILHELKLV